MNTEIYTLSLHDALPIFLVDLVVDTLLESAGDLGEVLVPAGAVGDRAGDDQRGPGLRDRKSTRLNSSHVRISYAVFCLKKKRKLINTLLLIARKIEHQN